MPYAFYRIPMNLRLKLIDLLGRTHISKWYNFVKESQYWDVSRQVEYQNEQLRRLVNHAYHNVPYYKRLFDSIRVKPSEITCKEDLQKIPVLTKAIIRNNFNDLLFPGHIKPGSQERWTGGTTGVPLHYYSDRNSWDLHWALKYRAWEWGGYSVGKPFAILGGSSVIPDAPVSLKRIFWNRLNGFYMLPASHLSSEIMAEYAEIIKKKNIRFIRGYPSAISAFAQFCTENNIMLPTSEVITTAEVLQTQYKNSIKAAFNCPIIDTYGCADGGGNANTCECDCGFHISFEAGIWEVCDETGNPVPEHQPGELTLTSLTNYAMPTLRYQPGDIIENHFNTDVCQCGRTLPRLKQIVGRTTEILKFSNGISLSGPAFTILFSRFPMVKWQLIQNDPDSVDVNVIPDSGFNLGHEDTIIRLMKHHCGAGIDVKLQKVTEIIPSKSGKHMIIINKTAN
jgi:phenylacetate-CoA ligase